MSITIAYFTNRKQPKIEWFFRSLKRECKGDYSGMQLIVVDYHAEDPGRKENFAGLMRMTMGAENHPEDPFFIHVAPKPCIWQGAHRLTTKNYFAASNARNTAFALCKHDFIACVDDVSVLMAGWLDNVLHAQRHQYIVMGAYKKVLELDLADDGLISYKEHPPGVDSRWRMGSSYGIENSDGRMFFGCSFGLPLEAALTVNGFDEICDGQGAEDYDFGIRLQRSGRKLFYNRNMLTLESEELHGVPGNEHFIRISKDMHWNGSVIGSDHVLLRRVTNESRFRTLSNEYDLRDLRNRIQRGEPFPIMTTPQNDWRDGVPLKEM